MKCSQIQFTLNPLGAKRFDLIELACNRIKGKKYPHGSLGRACYWDMCKPMSGVSLAQYRAAYTLARAAVA